MADNSSLPRICVLGSLNIDLVSYVSHHPAPGETLTSNSFAVSPGGKGANQAVACAKLSRSQPTTDGSNSSSSKSITAHVAMVGAVGADTYGDMLLANLSAHGVDVGNVLAPRELKTGVAIIIVDEPTGQNRIVLSPEANHLGMAPADFARSIRPRVLRGVGGGGGGGSGGSEELEELEGVKQQQQQQQQQPDLLIMQLEIPLQTVLLALAAAKEEGVAVLLNPAPAVALPDEVYEGLAHLIVNETEASLLSGLPVEKLDTAEGCNEVATWFLQKGVAAVIITLGGRGVYFMSDDGAERLVPAEKVKEVVDTTAAGDTFVGQYALEVVASKGGEFAIEAAVKKANKAAARTVERKGAQHSIPWRDELV